MHKKINSILLFGVFVCLTGAGPVVSAAGNTNSGVVDVHRILEMQWSHVKTHTNKDGHPPLISSYKKDPSMMIPYAFGDGGDLDNDGRLAYHENPKNFELLVVSESASYALLRSVWMNDKETFDKVWKWTANNLQHCNIKYVFSWDTKTDTVEKSTPEKMSLDKDHLFAWRWIPTVNGRPEDGIIVGSVKKNGVWVDGWGFASDADEDIALALILAGGQWGSGTNIYNYNAQAKLILNDLWNKGTVIVNGIRYLNGGTGSRNNIEPGYLAPASYRVFEQFDTEHSWIDLVNSSYEVYNQSASLTMKDGEYNGKTFKSGGKGVGLVPDWIEVVNKNGKNVFVDPTMRKEPEFGADAFRAYWRIALDYRWFKSKEAYGILTGEKNAVSPVSVIKKKFTESWSDDPTKDTKDPRYKSHPFDYNELGKIPRNLAHDGSYIANENSGGGVDTGNTGNRADTGPYGVWLAFFSAINDKEMYEKFLDPMIRKDTDPLQGNPEDGYTYLRDGWLREDADGYYWTIHDMNIWESDTEYYSNTWGWFGLAQYFGLIKNLYNKNNSEPGKATEINLYKEVNGEKIRMEQVIDDIDVIVEIKAQGGNPENQDFFYMTVSSSDPLSTPIIVKCGETEINSGLYRAKLHLKAFSNDALDEIGMQNGSTITFHVKGKKYSIPVGDISFGIKALYDSCEGNANLLGGYCWTTDDKSDGNLSQVRNAGKIFIEGNTVRGKAALLEYALKLSPLKKNNYELYAMMGIQLFKPQSFTNGKKGSANLNEFKGMGFWIKGSGHRVTITLKSKAITDWDDYSYNIESTPNKWRHYILKFTENDFQQEGWGRKISFNRAISNIEEIQFKASSKISGEEGWFALDEIDFLGVPEQYVYTIDDFNAGGAKDWWYNCDKLHSDEETTMPVLKVIDKALNIDFQMGSHMEVWAVVGKNLAPRNVNDYQALSLDVTGVNSYIPFSVELADENDERYAFNIRDNFSGKKTFNIPFKYFTTRSWQPEDAKKDSRFDLKGIRKFCVNFIVGKGSVKIDNIQFTKNSNLIPAYKPMNIDFEDGSLCGLSRDTPGIRISVNERIKNSGNKALKAVMTGKTKQAIKYGLPEVKSGDKIVLYVYVPKKNHIHGVNVGILDKNYNWADQWINGIDLKGDKFNKIEFTLPSGGKDKFGKKMVLVPPFQMLKIEFHPGRLNFKNETVYIDDIYISSSNR